MKTTLILDDLVARKAKQKAAEMGTTLSELTNRALRELIFSDTGKKNTGKSFRMLTFRGTGHGPISMAEMKQLRDEGR